MLQISIKNIINLINILFVYIKAKKNINEKIVEKNCYVKRLNRTEILLI